MPFIRAQLDAKEPEAAPEGGGYGLRITKVNPEAETAAGSPAVVCTIVIESPAGNYSTLQHWILLIDSKVKPEKHEMYKLNTQRFLNLFDIPHEEDGFDTDDLLGATADDVYLIQQEDKNGVIRNNIRLPRMEK